MTAFNAETISELRYTKVGGTEEFDGLIFTLVVSPETIATTRWGIVDRLVFRVHSAACPDDFSFFEAIYEYGATEQQDYDYLIEDDEFDCDEVVPQVVTVTKYVKAPR